MLGPGNKIKFHNVLNINLHNDTANSIVGMTFGDFDKTLTVSFDK